MPGQQPLVPAPALQPVAPIDAQPAPVIEPVAPVVEEPTYLVDDPDYKAPAEPAEPAAVVEPVAPKKTGIEKKIAKLTKRVYDRDDIIKANDKVIQEQTQEIALLRQNAQQVPSSPALRPAAAPIDNQVNPNYSSEDSAFVDERIQQVFANQPPQGAVEQQSQQLQPQTQQQQVPQQVQLTQTEQETREDFIDVAKEMVSDKRLPEDYFKVISASQVDPPVEVFNSAMLDAEVGPQMLLHMAKNPGEMSQLRGLPAPAINQYYVNLRAQCVAAQTAAPLVNPTPIPNTEQSQPAPAVAPVIPVAQPTAVRPSVVPSGNGGKPRQVNLNSVSTEKFREIRNKQRAGTRRPR
jgi:hypothetical protein